VNSIDRLAANLGMDVLSLWESLALGGGSCKARIA